MSLEEHGQQEEMHERPGGNDVEFPGFTYTDDAMGTTKQTKKIQYKLKYAAWNPETSSYQYWWSNSGNWTDVTPNNTSKNTWVPNPDTGNEVVEVDVKATHNDNTTEECDKPGTSGNAASSGTFRSEDDTGRLTGTVGWTAWDPTG